MKNELSLRNISSRIVPRYGPYGAPWAELWIDNELKSDEAMEAIRNTFGKESNSAEAKCKNCLELSPREFVLCWNCGEKILS